MISRATPAARRRAAVLVLVALAVAVTCTFLGRWQWHRHVARDARADVVEANWAAPPVTLDSVVPSVADEPVAAGEWRTVTARGEYLADATVLLRNRPVDGQPAYHVLVPFRVEGSDALLVVDRGWVPLGADGQTVTDVPAPPSGTVDLVARLRAPEAASERSAPPGQVQNANVAQVLAAGGLDPSDDPAGSPAAYRWYAQLGSESPTAAMPLGSLPAPSTDRGPHLSYAFQWWIFALAALVAFGWMARRELVDVAPPPPAPRRTGRRDEDAEDALIDAQQP